KCQAFTAASPGSAHKPNASTATPRATRHRTCRRSGWRGRQRRSPRLPPCEGGQSVPPFALPAPEIESQISEGLQGGELLLAGEGGSVHGCSPRSDGF